MKRALAALRGKLIIVPLAGIVFAGALGAGFQWGAPGESAFVRVLDGEIGGDGSPRGDLGGYVTQRDAATITVRHRNEPTRVEFAPNAEVELLAPIHPTEIQIGDWIVAGGTDDNVNTFITTGIVVIPADRALAGADAAQAIRGRR